MNKLILMMLSCSLIGTATTAHGDHYFSGGREIPLGVDSSKVTLRFLSDVPATHAEQILASIQRIVSPLEDSYAKDGFVVCSLVTSTNYEAFMDSIREVDEIGWVEPYYTDTAGHPHLANNGICAAFDPGTESGELDSILASLGLSIKEPLLENIYSLERTDTASTSIVEVANALYTLSQTVFAHPDFCVPIVRHSYEIHDYYKDQQWHIQRVIGELNVASVWDFSGVTDSIVVAVIDDGFIYHEDFPRERIAQGADFVTGGKWPYPFRYDGHGMACAGIIGASHSSDSAAGDSSSSGIFSLNDRVKIMPIRVFEQDEGQVSSEMAKAINWPWQHGASILSNSWGYLPGNEYDVVTAAIDSARTFGRNGLGCPVIFSSGNGGISNVAYPARLPSCLAVGATDLGGFRWDYSQYGPELDLVAPSSETGLQGHVWSLDQMDNLGLNPEVTNYWGNIVEWHCGQPNDVDYNCNFGGTSAAAPVVSGVASLVLAMDSTLSAGEVYDILRGSAAVHLFAHSLPETPVDEYGYGRVDAFRAILSLVRGDANNDASFNVSDLTYMVDWLMRGVGPEPFPSTLLGDANCDGQANVSDLTFMVDALFEGGPQPPRPCFEYGD